MIHFQPQLRLCFALGIDFYEDRYRCIMIGLGNHTKRPVCLLWLTVKCSARKRIVDMNPTSLSSSKDYKKHGRLCPNLHKRGSRLLVKLEESHAVLVQFSSTIQVHTHLWFDFVFTYNRLLQQSHPILHPAEAMSHEMPALKQETHYQKSVRTHIS